MKKSCFALTATLSLALPTAAQAESLVWIEQAYDRLQLEPYAYSNRDTVDWFAETIAQGQAWSLTIVPQELAHYTFLGACDHDCTQFSITIFDYRGQQVARNVGSDGHTSTSAYLSAGQTYTIQFFPENCDAGFCFTIGNALR
jgi:hypothetical protein